MLTTMTGRTNITNFSYRFHSTYTATVHSLDA